MMIKLDLPADVAAGDGEPLVAEELAEAARKIVGRQSDEATKGIAEFYDGWKGTAAKLSALTRHGLEVGFRAKPEGAVALVRAPGEDLSAGEISTLALEELGFDKEDFEAEVDAGGKEHYLLKIPAAGELTVIVFGPGSGWESLA